jgi:hypothetical protein
LADVAEAKSGAAATADKPRVTADLRLMSSVMISSCDWLMQNQHKEMLCG